MNRRECLVATAGIFNIILESIASAEESPPSTDAYFVEVRYQTDYCNSNNCERYSTNEKCFDEIARQALKKYERMYSLALHTNNKGYAGDAIHYWTTAHKDNLHLERLTKDTYKFFKWYEREIPHGELRPATFTHTVAEIDDIAYFRKKLFAKLNFPK